jgi:hypothetical protein
MYRQMGAGHVFWRGNIKDDDALDQSDSILKMQIGQLFPACRESQHK